MSLSAARGDVRLDGHVTVEGGLPERVVAHARQIRFARIGLIAAESLGQHVTDLEMLGLLRRTEREEQLRVHPQRAGLEAEADQERGTLGQSGIDAPGTPTPRAARRLARRLLIARGIEAIPRDVGLGVPAKSLRLAVELAQRRHFRGELERKAPLDEALLLRLIGAQEPRGVLASLAHR